MTEFSHKSYAAGGKTAFIVKRCTLYETLGTTWFPFYFMELQRQFDVSVIIVQRVSTFMMFVNLSERINSYER